MKTLIKLAWRNCWRNKLRSFIIMGGIIIGVWSSLFLMGFIQGMTKNRTDQVLSTQIGMMQIHHKNWKIDQNINNTLNYEKVEKVLLKNGVENYSIRTVIEGSANTAHGAGGVKIIGIDTTQEKRTLDLYSKMKTGTFLTSERSYPIIIGKKLSEKLKLDLDSKVLLSFTNQDTVQISKNFRVSGIFQGGDQIFDETTVFVPINKLKKLTGKEMYHEVIIQFENREQIEHYYQLLKKDLPELSVMEWKDVNTQMGQSEEYMGTYMTVLMIIILIGLSFGLINTLIMSILERKKEIGVIRALGMTKLQITQMIAFESVIYGIVGGALGLLLGYLTVQYFTVNGIDFSAYGDALADYGISSVVYFALEPVYYATYGTLIFITTILGSLYPARIANKLNPIEAIRSI